MFPLPLLITAIAFIVLQYLYLKIMHGYYASQIQTTQNAAADQPSILSQSILYLVVLSGFLYFVIKPNRSVYDAAIYGALSYGTVSLYNWTYFAHWSIFTVMLDLVSGAAIFGAAAKVHEFV